MPRYLTGAFALALALAAPAVSAQDTARPAAPSDAQGRRGGRGDDAGRLDRYVTELTEAVSLSPQQAAQIRPLLQQEMDARRALMGERGPRTRRGDRADAQQAEANRDARQDARREAMRTQMQALQAQTDAQLLPLLTEQQVAAYQRFRTEQANRRPRNGGHDGHGAEAPAGDVREPRPQSND